MSSKANSGIRDVLCGVLHYAGAQFPLREDGGL